MRNVSKILHEFEKEQDVDLLEENVVENEEVLTNNDDRDSFNEMIDDKKNDTYTDGQRVTDNSNNEMEMKVDDGSQDESERNSACSTEEESPVSCNVSDDVESVMSDSERNSDLNDYFSILIRVMRLQRERG